MCRYRTLLFLTLALIILSALLYPVEYVKALRDKKALLPVADSSVSSYDPDWNLGRDMSLFVYIASDERFAYLMFDLSEIPAGSAIEKATLQLYAGAVSIKGIIGVYHCLSNDWTELGITYNNRPAYSPEPLDTANVTAKLAWYEWNVTNVARSTFDTPDRRLSLVVKVYTSGAVDFSSRNAPYLQPDVRPRIEVTYDAPPARPGVDPVLIGLIAIGIVSISGVGLGLVYIRRKRRNQSTQET